MNSCITKGVTGSEMGGDEKRCGEQEIVMGMSYVCEPIFRSLEAVAVECHCDARINNSSSTFLVSA